MTNYKILKSDVESKTQQFLVDEEADLSILPKKIGSVALVAATGDVYILNNKKIWVQL